MSEFSIMINWFCKSCHSFFDLSEKHNDLTLDLIECPYCCSKSVYNGNFIAKAKNDCISTQAIIELCELYDEMIIRERIPAVIDKLQSKFS
jgi:DNA-directed RNA polymerase subunit RPC12/RpoP